MYDNKPNRLTERELNVAICLQGGLTNPEISKKLNITVATVKAHISSILEKFNAKNRIDIMLMLTGVKRIKNPIIRQQMDELFNTYSYI